MRPPRVQTWSIEEDADGVFEVTRGNRPVTTGLRSLAAAKDVVRHTRKPGERVWHVAPDGYRNDLTRSFQDPVERREQIRRESVSPDDPRPARTRYLARYGRGRRQA